MLMTFVCVLKENWWILYLSETNLLQIYRYFPTNQRDEKKNSTKLVKTFLLTTLLKLNTIFRKVWFKNWTIFLLKNMFFLLTKKKKWNNLLRKTFRTVEHFSLLVYTCYIDSILLFFVCYIGFNPKPTSMMLKLYHTLSFSLVLQNKKKEKLLPLINNWVVGS